MIINCHHMYSFIDINGILCHDEAIILWRKDDSAMKQRIVSLMVLFCLVLSLTACGGGDSSADGADAQDGAATPLTEEEYQRRVEELSTDIGTAMSSMSGLSATDEDSFREGIQAIRTMVEPFRDFAAISNPPEAWTDAHAKIAEGCNGFADSLEGLCDSAEGMLDGEATQEDYNNAVTEYTTGLTEAATLLTEGFGMMDA